MAKLQVFETEQGNPVPFLRGILTRSLQDLGLSFDEAYALASAVRREIGEESDDDEAAVTTRDLRERVLGHLRRDHGAETAQRYEHPRGNPPDLNVLCAEGGVSTFSRSRLTRSLQSCGLSGEAANRIPGSIFQHYLDRGKTEIRSARLRELTARYLRRTLGRDAEERYRLWLEFSNSGRPLLLLIGGTSGCGKSTVASELASRLDIVRAQSTDMLREVMRMMVPRRLIPVLHTSSFEAWRVLPTHGGIAQDFDTVVADGFRSQAEHVSVACEAVIQRAASEQVSLILEGVHVQTPLLDLVPGDADATVVLVMLGVLNPDDLRARFQGRGRKSMLRSSARYLEHFDAIWSLQSTLLSEADAAGIPVVSNHNKQAAVQQIMSIILDAVARERALQIGI
jgi:2-phosphoglycerate kinase